MVLELSPKRPLHPQGAAAGGTHRCRAVQCSSVIPAGTLWHLNLGAAVLGTRTWCSLSLGRSVHTIFAVFKICCIVFSLRVTLCFWAMWGAMQWLSFCGLYQGMVWEQCFECNVEAVILKPSRFNIFYYVGIEKGTGAIDLSKVLMLALCCSWRAGQPSGAKGCLSCPACLLQAGQGAAGPDESNMDILEACAGEKE